MTSAARLAALGAILVLSLDAAAQAPRNDPPEPRPRGLTFAAALDVPLAYGRESSEGAGTQGEETLRSPRLSLTLRYSPPETYWFGRLSVHRYLDESRQAPWNPDFTYSFGYDDWHPGTVAVTYDNYNGNRFNPDRSRNESITRFEEGSLSAVYRIPIPEKIEALFVPNPDKRLSASIGAHLTPRFQRADSSDRGEWKRSVSFGVRNRFYRWWYLEARALYYPVEGQQQPWDPDYTYGFGYSDWHPGKVSVQYSNYAGNRFPWRSSSRGTAFRDGSVSVSWSHTW